MKTISDHALAAKNIRKELKALSPKTKFSITSKTYSGGSSVYVSYEDGPAWETVNKLVKKYQYGDFDGMTDCYNYNPKFDDSKGSAKYVLVERSLSSEFIKHTAAALRMEVHFDMYGRYETTPPEHRNKLSRTMQATDF